MGRAGRFRAKPANLASRDTDNPEGGSVLRRVQAEVLVDGVFAAFEEALHEGLIHDSYGRRVFIVGVVEIAPTSELGQRQYHRSIWQLENECGWAGYLDHSNEVEDGPKNEFGYVSYRITRIPEVKCQGCIEVLEANRAPEPTQAKLVFTFVEADGSSFQQEVGEIRRTTWSGL